MWNSSVQINRGREEDDIKGFRLKFICRSECEKMFVKSRLEKHISSVQYECNKHVSVINI